MGNSNSHAADDSHDSWRAARENRNRRDNRASNDAVDGGSGIVIKTIHSVVVYN